MTFICPVCGWQGLIEALDEPMSTYEICSCCGTEFGYDLSYFSEVKEIRRRWLVSGAPWFYNSSDVFPAKPENWSQDIAEEQIRIYLERP